MRPWHFIMIYFDTLENESEPFSFKTKSPFYFTLVLEGNLTFSLLFSLFIYHFINSVTIFHIAIVGFFC